MFVFEPRTAFLITGLFYLLMPIITWFVLARQRSHAVTLWCAGGILLGFTGILTSLQGLISMWIIIVIGAFMFHSANLLRIQSLRLELGIPWKSRWMLLGLLLIVLIVNGIHHGLGDEVLRGQFTSLVGCGMLLHLALLAWRIGRIHHSPNAKWLSYVYFLASGVFLYRAVALVGHTGEVNPAAEGFISILLSVVLLLTSVIGHLAYVGMHLDRSMRRELQAAAEIAREEESRRLGAQIAQLDRQRSLGEMSTSLGHELNQPLTAILTNAEVAQRGLHTGGMNIQQHDEILDKIIQNTERASQIIERIRGFIRPMPVQSEVVDLQGVSHEVAELLSDEVRKHKVKLVFADPAALVQVSGDAIQLSQIVLNVLRNAIEALKSVTCREIHISCKRVESRAILVICDNGPGLAPEILTQIGTPFFTTKPNGLGMGFSISRTIAAQHGGTLDIANAEGGGARVELNLPALPEPQS